MADEAAERMMSDEARMIRFALRVGVAFLLFIVALWVLATFRPRYREIEFELPQDLIEARARWQANSVVHYRLAVRRSHPLNPSTYTCLQEFEVVQEGVTATLHDDCMGYHLRTIPMLGKIEPSLTVTDLFEKLAKETTTVRFLQDAACGKLELVYAKYDPHYGFPQRIDYVQETASPENLGWATHAKYRGNSSIYSCLAIQDFTRGYIEITLTALP
jgi:hypothetical protein